MWLDIVLGLLLLITLIDGVRRHWFLSLLKAFGSLASLYLIVRRGPWLRIFLEQNLDLSSNAALVVAYLAILMIVALLVGLLIRVIRKGCDFDKAHGLVGRVAGAAFALADVFLFLLVVDLLLTGAGWREHLHKTLDHSRIAGIVHRAECRVVRPSTVQDHQP